MTDSSPLVAIVVGVGLAVLTTRDFASGGQSEEPAGWHTPLFVLAVQLIGFAIVGAALYVATSSFESGHKLGPHDLRAENLFITALVLLIAFVLIRNTWGRFFHAPLTLPWERDVFDRIQPLLGFVLAIGVTGLIGLVIDELLIGTSAKIRGGAAVFIIGAILSIGLGLATAVLRLMVGGEPSPRAFAQSRRRQQRLLRALAKTEGHWVAVRVKAVGALEPALSMTAAIWVTQRGWYWRSEDAGALTRYHKWAANHVRVPTPALHSQAVTVFVGIVLRSRRGLRITPIGRRWWWIDAWRSHRDRPAPVADKSSPEYEAGLVFISHHELQAAGLTVRVEDEVG